MASNTGEGKILGAANFKSSREGKDSIGDHASVARTLSTLRELLSPLSCTVFFGRDFCGWVCARVSCHVHVAPWYCCSRQNEVFQDIRWRCKSFPVQSCLPFTLDQHHASSHRPARPFRCCFESCEKKTSSKLRLPQHHIDISYALQNPVHPAVIRVINKPRHPTSDASAMKQAAQRYG
ncbi:unnamed protein product [Scytosiphon promiscuus]